MNIKEIYESTKEKTKILVAEFGQQELLHYVIEFTQKEVDFVTEKYSNISDNDFVIFIFENLKAAAELSPNIVYLPTEVTSKEAILAITKNITGGGILIYPEENSLFSEVFANVENYFRKISYKSLENKTNDDELILETEMGAILLDQSLEINIKNIEGIRLLCQQIGIMEEDFYEAVISFSEYKKRKPAF